MGKRAMAAAAVLGLVLAGCTGSSKGGHPTADASGGIAVVVDTDMGQDDAMALLYLLRRPDVRIRAITVSGTGLAHCGPGVANALALLDLARAPEDVPVSCGPREPLPGHYPYPGAFPTSWRIATDRMYGVDLPRSGRRPADTPAPELLLDAVRAADEPVHLLTLGPLTNVALALREDPGLARDLADVTIMGGAIDVPGNAPRNPAAELNVWVDPVAAREVLRSGADVTVVPLDATDTAPVTPFFADAVARHHVTAEAGFVHELFRREPWLTAGTYYFWDPLSAAIMMDPALATIEPHRLSVLEGEKETQGRMIDDPGGSPVDLAVDTDALAFEIELLNTLNGDHAVTSTRPEPVATIGFDRTSCRYRGPASLPAELVAVRVRNPTASPWSAVLVAIPEGRTFADLAALAEGFRVGDRPPRWVRAVSGTDLAPGEERLAAWQLEPGSYGLVCAGGTDRAVRAVAELEAS